MSGRLFEIGEIGEIGKVEEEDWEGKEENQGQASTAWHRPSHLSTIMWMECNDWNEQVSKMIPFCAVSLLVVPTKLTAGRFLLLINY